MKRQTWAVLVYITLLNVALIYQLHNTLTAQHVTVDENNEDNDVVPKVLPREENKNTLPHLRMIFGVFTAPKYLSRRTPIRNTWWTLFPKDTKGIDWEAFWILGEKGLREQEIDDIIAENKTHGDIIFVPMVDKYKDLSMKTMLFIKFAIENYNFDYLLKCDDDTFIVPDRLLELAKYFPKRGVYYGIHMDYKKEDSRIPKTRLPARYAAGAGYILSYELALFMYNNYWALPVKKRPDLHYYEDLNTGLFLSELGVDQVEPRFMAACDPHTALVHYVKPRSFQRLFDMYTQPDFKTFCSADGKVLM